MLSIPQYFLFAISAVLASPAVVIPTVNGPFHVVHNTARLIDTTRFDPFAPTKQHRNVMISLFFPAHCNTTKLIKYMPPFTAAFEDAEFGGYGIPNGTFERLRIEVCRSDDEKTIPRLKNTPDVLVFSPALGTTRLAYNALAQSIAKRGFLVVTVDHPYDADIVEFPDGSYITAADLSSNASILLDVRTRAADVSFVLGQLAQPSVVESFLPETVRHSQNFRLEVSRAGVFGHSLGGCTAATAMLRDDRFIGGINYDGSFFGAITHKGLTKPFMLFAHQGKTITSDPTWTETWPLLQNWKLAIGLNHSQHYTFSDFPVLLRAIGVESVPPGLQGLIGSLQPELGQRIETAYTEAFFKYVFDGWEEKLLKNGTHFKDVQYLAGNTST